MNIGDNIIRLLKAQHLSQKALSERTGLTPSYINQICMNKKTPTIETLEHICKALGTSLDPFFSSDDSARAGNPQECSLLASYRTLNKKERKAVLALINALSTKDTGLD